MLVYKSLNSIKIIDGNQFLKLARLNKEEENGVWSMTTLQMSPISCSILKKSSCQNIFEETPKSN